MGYPRFKNGDILLPSSEYIKFIENWSKGFNDTKNIKNHRIKIFELIFNVNDDYCDDYYNCIDLETLESKQIGMQYVHNFYDIDLKETRKLKLNELSKVQKR